MMLNSLLTRAVVAASAQRGLLDLAKSVALQRNEFATAESCGRLIQEQDLIEKQANELILSDYHPLNIQGILSLWVTIEVTVEDTVLAVLIHDEKLSRRIIDGFTKGKPVIPAGPLNENSAKNLYQRMERAAREQPTTMDSYCRLLEQVDVKLHLTTEESEILNEIYYVRNCVMHRGGVIDEDVMEKAPKLGLSPSDKFHLDKKSYTRYIEAGNQFAHKLLEAILKSRHIKTKIN